jgi:hypothetical protein
MKKLIAALIICTGLVAPALSSTALAQADDDPWSITVASWNLLNFGDRKAGVAPHQAHPALIARMAAIIGRYNIVVLQEVLNDGAGVTDLIEADLPNNYQCEIISQPAGRAGRRERYSVCYNTEDMAYNGAFDYLGNPYTAIDTTQQTAQQIWMRPPARVSFSYTKPDTTTFDFDITTIHTKPQYSQGARPAGTPTMRQNLPACVTNYCQHKPTCRASMPSAS